MNCDNTISAGFQFMLGKLLFDMTVFGVSVLIGLICVVILIWCNRRE